LSSMLMLFLTSCGSNDAEDVVVKEKHVLKIYIFAPDRPVITRADIGQVDASDEENAIHSIHVWAFETGTNTLVGHVYLSDPDMNETFTGEGDETATGKTVTMEISDDFANKMVNNNAPNVDIFVAANVTPYNCGLSLDASTTSTTLKAALIEHKATGGDFFGVTSIADRVMAVPQNGLPMSGVLSNQVVGGTSPVYSITPRVKLVRAVSKLRFIFAKSPTLANDPHLSIKSISLNSGVLPKQEYLFLTAPYSDEVKSHVKTDGGYEVESVLVSDVGGAGINTCDDLNHYVYNSETMDGPAYEALINEGLTKQGSKPNADLSEVGRFYLRESELMLNGKIKYTMVDGDVKEATFTMNANGDFTRNHTWLVYGYFVGTTDLVLQVVDVKVWENVTTSHTVYNW